MRNLQSISDHRLASGNGAVKNANSINHEASEFIKISKKNYLVFNCHYPEENPPDAVESITDALAHVGAFDGIKKATLLPD